MPQVVAAGEAMLELSRAGTDWRLGHGGDTLNSAIHLARLGLSCCYLTAVGADPLSSAMRAALDAEAIDTSFILTDHARPTGLYAITTDSAGERSFTYWRRGSAASALTAHSGFAGLAGRCLGTELLLFSLISLAILDEEGRATLLKLARAIRARGGLIAFDGNYRPALWGDPAAACRWRDEAAALADLGLPTLADEAAFGLPDDASAVARHWRGLGAREVVVKLGAKGCLLDDGVLVPPPVAIDVVDTSGAGDAFNAGYLAARLCGRAPGSAALDGHRLAGWVIGRSGAIPPVDEDAPYAAIAAALS